jgi:hypothetical protein
VPSEVQTLRHERSNSAHNYLFNPRPFGMPPHKLPRTYHALK